MMVLRAADHKRMKWKNGGGETIEIAVFPPDASVENFDWRISMATVATDGPFSIFPGIDRTLSVIDGNGMSLDIEGRPGILLLTDSEPLPFAADIAVTARLANGPITDLNVMTRRGRFTHSVVRLEAGEKGAASTDGRDILIIVATGEADLDRNGEALRLDSGDAFIVEGDGYIAITPRAPLYLVTLSPQDPR